MDEVQDEMPQVDTCLVVGANDITNEAAETEEDSVWAAARPVSSYFGGERQGFTAAGLLHLRHACDQGLGSEELHLPEEINGWRQLKLGVSPPKWLKLGLSPGL